MDSHYDQVMKARQAQADADTRLYFAYSTILDRRAFEQWRQEHGYSFFDLPAGGVGEAGCPSQACGTAKTSPRFPIPEPPYEAASVLSTSRYVPVRGNPTR